MNEPFPCCLEKQEVLMVLHLFFLAGKIGDDFSTMGIIFGFIFIIAAIILMVRRTK